MDSRRRHVPIILFSVLMTVAGCGGSAQPVTEATVTPAPVPTTDEKFGKQTQSKSVVTIENTRNDTFVVTIAITHEAEITVIYRNGSVSRIRAPVSTGTARTTAPVEHVEPVGDSVFTAAYRLEPNAIRTVSLGPVPDNAVLVYTIRPVGTTEDTPPLTQWGATPCARAQCEHLFIL